MPDRVLRQNILTSDAVNQLSWAGEVFYRRLMSVADDFGRYEARPSILRAFLYSLKLDRVSDSDVVKWLGECSKAGLVRIYSVDNKEYLEILKFDQRLRIMKSKYPDPADKCQQMTADVSNPPPVLETEYELEKENNTGAASPPTATKNLSDKPEKKKFIAPTLQQVSDYFLSTIGNAKNEKSWPEDKCRFEAAELFDHYKANGWVQGRGKPIKDWQAACRNWIRNGIKGVFEKNAPVKKENAAVQISKPALPQLLKIEIDINYLYEMFLEDKCTALSIYPEQYDHLKKWGRIQFTDEEVKNIRSLAEKSIAEQGIASSEKLVIQVMKKHGVIEFFKQLRSQAKETVFDVDGKETTAA